MKILIITKKIWNSENLANFKFKNRVHNKITKKLINETRPKIIFFIHWSKYISKDIYNKYECIQFHCSDLPNYRGGTPVQHQILKGLNNTKLTAFKVCKKLDSGPIYLKKKISLTGKASEIYARIEKKSFEMISLIIKKKIQPKKQWGKGTIFKRRKEDQSTIDKKINTISKLHNFIRMLDAEGYPRSNIKSNGFVYEFYDSKIKNSCIYGKFKIKKK